MNKKLRPTTIIPRDLYVERAADRQLRQIIDDMGRPGYVLVARQMGKTNLLINMKRERKGEIVLYLDLSNRFDSVRAWFRHVIDSLIESYQEIFTDSAAEIAMQRQQIDLEPNVEFDRHLRMLLRTTDRRFIIILDEIDSLVNAPYSDVVLAQVRSMYFSRVNYQEYERLTYVLSGVAEPSDLIKDKNISPFNIGEKIYLDDFNREEFDLFINKSGLPCAKETAEAIFSWTKGNPRMTWDVCSELEDRIALGEESTIQLVNAIVEKLYLRDFDRAPVDHIRTLVESDAQVRDAIVSMRYGKADYLDDRTKSRLYLSGITRSGPDGTVEIKNPIIDAALSDRWISHISSVRTNLIKTASENVRAEKFEEAARQFELALEDPLLENTLTAATRYECAMAYFYTGDMAAASEQLEKCLSETIDKSIVQRANYYLGLTHVARGLNEQALRYLTAARNGPLPRITIGARLTMMPALLGISPLERPIDVFTHGEELIAELDKPEVNNDEQSLEFLVSAIYNMAVAHTVIEDFASAERELNRALSIARPELQNTILSRQYDLPQVSTEKKQELLRQAARVIIDNGLDLSSRKIESLRLNQTSLALTLVRLDKHGMRLEFDELARYTATSIFSASGTVAETLLWLYESINSEEKRSKYVGLIERAVSDYFNDLTELGSRLKLLRLVSAYSESSRVSEWRSQYLGELEKLATNEPLTEEDYGTLARVAFALIQKKAHREINRLFAICKSFELSDPADKTGWLQVLSFYEMEYLAVNGQKDQARKVAVKLLMLIDKAGKESTQPETDGLIPEIRRRALALVPRQPVKNRPSQKIGRNDKVQVRYGDSGIQLRKFKQVEADLAEGRCTLVQNETP